MNFLTVFSKMLQLFLIMAVGYLAGRVKFLNRGMRSMMTDLVLNITMPAMFVAAVINAESLPEAGEFIVLFGVVLVEYAVALGISFLLVRLLRFPQNISGSSVFILVFGNMSFMGFPVMQAIWGNEGVFYAMMFTLPFNIMLDSLCARLILHDKKAALPDGEKQTISPGGEKRTVSEPDGNKETRTAQSWKQILRSPIFIASVIAFALALVRIPVPEVIGVTLNSVGSVTTPLTMLIIWASLSDVPFREVFTAPVIYVLSFLKLIVMPVLIWLIFRLFLKNSMFLGVTTIINAMPVAAVGQMICLRYGCNEDFMAKAIFITTVCSVITIPLIAQLVT